MSTRLEAFKHFNTTPRARGSWSAKSEDGNTVVLALWSDQFRWQDRPLSYDGNARTGKSVSRFGAKERLRNLLWAKEHCEGLFRVVMVRRENPDKSQIEDAFPRDWVMKITELDETTGEFQAVRIEKAA